MTQKTNVPVFNYLLVTVAILIVFSCSNQKKILKNTKISVINPPFEGIEIPEDQFTIDASIDEIIRTKEGTKIIIPANSLKNKKGEIISGKAQIHYKSINTPAEIMLSGIPMRYDSAGVKLDFISAGMFQVDASQNGEKLDIVNGKKVDVQFASYKEGDDFSFYKMNEQSGSWAYKGISTPVANEEKEVKLKNFGEDNLFQLDIDYSTNKELEPFNGLKWLCLDKTEKNPINAPRILKELWHEIELKTIDSKKGVYQMTLIDPTEVIKFKVSPYLMNEEGMEEMTNKIANLNETIRLRKEEEEKIQFEADILRNYSISSFGTYNWDKIEREMLAGNLASTDAVFELENSKIDEKTSIFHFSGKDKLLSRVDNKWEKLVYNPQEKNLFIIVLPNNYVAVSDESDFQQAINSKTKLFKLKKKAQKVSSIKDLDEILAKI
jgi:hypothetical protein